MHLMHNMHASRTEIVPRHHEQSNNPHFSRSQHQCAPLPRALPPIDAPSPVCTDTRKCNHMPHMPKNLLPPPRKDNVNLGPPPATLSVVVVYPLFYCPPLPPNFPCIGVLVLFLALVLSLASTYFWLCTLGDIIVIFVLFSRVFLLATIRVHDTRHAQFLTVALCLGSKCWIAPLICRPQLVPLKWGSPHTLRHF